MAPAQKERFGPKRHPVASRWGHARAPVRKRPPSRRLIHLRMPAARGQSPQRVQPSSLRPAIILSLPFPLYTDHIIRKSSHMDPRMGTSFMAELSLRRRRLSWLKPRGLAAGGVRSRAAPATEGPGGWWALTSAPARRPPRRRPPWRCFQAREGGPWGRAGARSAPLSLRALLTPRTTPHSAPALTPRPPPPRRRPPGRCSPAARPTPSRCPCRTPKGTCPPPTTPRCASAGCPAPRPPGPSCAAGGRSRARPATHRGG